MSILTPDLTHDCYRVGQSHNLLDKSAWVGKLFYQAEARGCIA